MNKGRKQALEGKLCFFRPSLGRLFVRALLSGALVGMSIPAGTQIISHEDSVKPRKSASSPESADSRSQHRYSNRLIHEKSPYLLLHAHNPVNWYPWGEEAFAKAKRENKPIFLSVGYYTCHWCHVMERESYSNPAIAELLNRWFVSIKVDREERPDIDNEYMSFVENCRAVS